MKTLTSPTPDQSTTNGSIGGPAVSLTDAPGYPYGETASKRADSSSSLTSTGSATVASPESIRSVWLTPSAS